MNGRKASKVLRKTSVSILDKIASQPVAAYARRKNKANFSNGIMGSKNACEALLQAVWNMYEGRVSEGRKDRLYHVTLKLAEQVSADNAGRLINNFFSHIYNEFGASTYVWITGAEEGEYAKTGRLLQHWHVIVLVHHVVP